LRRIVPEPSKKVLTDHLRELEADRIISHTASAGRNGRTEYSLTEYGRTLIPVLAVMRAWGQTHRELVLGQLRTILPLAQFLPFQRSGASKSKQEFLTYDSLPGRCSGNKKVWG
jgi:HxlR-like helix-turn-helix